MRPWASCPYRGVRVFTYAGKSVESFKKAFATAVKAAGIEGFTFHDLRHTFNTNSYRAGVPIPTIMEITGHKSLSMFKRDTTISAENKKEAVGRLAIAG